MNWQRTGGVIWLTGVVMTASCNGAPGVQPTPVSPVAAPVETVSLSISGVQALGAPDQTTQLSAMATMSDGSTRDITATSTWQSSNTGVATVSATGLVRSVAFGSADITAAFSSRSAAARIQVRTENCSFTLRPSTRSFTAQGGSATVDVSAAGDCAWTASPTADWISMVSGISGVGDGRFTYQVGQNVGRGRSAGVTVGGQTLEVGQDGARFQLDVILRQGHVLTGPYSGRLTGPNGYVCTLPFGDDRVTCPSATFDAGTVVSLFLAVTPAYSNRSVWPGNTTGCDAILTSNTCRVEMNADRSVTIGAGVD